MSRIKKKVLKAKREKDQLTHKGRFTRIIPAYQ